MIVKVILSLILTISLFGKKKDIVFVTTKVDNGNVYVYVVNNNLFDITFQYDAKYKNLISLETLPIKGRVKSNKKKLIAKFMHLSGKYSLSSKISWVVGSKISFHNDNYFYRLPYELGTKKVITQGFNGIFSHKGNSKYAVDFGMKIGTKVFASRGGVVTHLKKDGQNVGVSKKYLNDANYITIRHGDGTYGKYTHLKYQGVLVSVGQKIKRGDFIGYSGNTGYSSGPHLHFIVFKGDTHDNRQSIPIRFISKNGIVTNPKKGQSFIAVE